MTTTHLLRSTVLILLAATAWSVELPGARLGQHISGPKVAMADLDGKVVVFEYWGINCPPCRANIPHISELASVADTERLIVIANQCQETGRTAQVWRECKGTDRPTVVDGGGLPNADVSGIPRCFVFDHTGKLVYDGSPADVTHDLLKKLLDAAPGPLVTGGPYKACAAEAAALKSDGKAIAPVLKALRTRAEKGKDDARTESQSLLDGVKTYLDRQLANIGDERTSDPPGAALRLQRMLVLTRGDQWGKPFEDLFKELKADKGFQDEVAAANALITIKVQAGRIGLGKGQLPASKRAEAQNLTVAVEQLRKRYPESQAARQAQELREGWAVQ